jgi:transposase InsO family protein
MAVKHLKQQMNVSERRACEVISQPRMTHRYKIKQPDKDKALTETIKRLARKYPCYGYRFITAKLRQEGWQVNKKRVQRIWRKEGLQVPYRRKFKKAKGSSENSCAVKKAQYPNHVWTYDFMSDQTEDGRKLKLLTVLDEFTRESPAIEVGRSIRAKDVIAVLEYLFVVRGAPKFIRSDNGPEFIADKIKKWLKNNHVETLYIEPASPWQNGYIESFNGKLRDDILGRELFYSVQEAKVIVEDWRLEYNNHRPHSGLGYMTPAAFAAGCIPSASPTAQPQEYRTGNMDNSLIKVGT